MGDRLIVLVFFLVLSLLVIAALSGVCVLVWRAVGRQNRPPTPTPGTQLAPMTPARAVEERLADLDDLHSRGVISDEERRDARVKIISEP